MQDAQDFGFNVGHAIKGIGQQSARTRIQGERHGVHGEIAAAHVVINRSGGYLRRLAGLIVFFRAGAGHFSANVARQQKVQGARGFINGLHDRASLFKILLQLERVSLDREIQVADDEAAENVAHCSAGEIYIELLGANNLGYLRQRPLLVRRKPGFHKINKVGHSGFTLAPPNTPLAPRPIPAS